MRRLSHIWSDPRVKPPYGSVEVDWGHSLSSNLRMLYLLNEMAGDVHGMGAAPTVGSLYTLGGTLPSWVTASTGPGVNFAGDSFRGCVDLTAQNSLFNIAAPFSLEVWWNWQAGNKQAYAGPFQTRVASQNGFQFTEQAASTTQARPHLVVWNGSSETNNFVGATTWARPFNKKFIWTFDGTTASLYVDGVPDTVSAGDAGYSNAMPATNLGAGYQSIAGVLVKVAIYTRVLSPREALWLAQEPFVVVRPIVRRRYFVPATGAAAATNRVPQLMLVGVGS